MEEADKSVGKGVSKEFQLWGKGGGELKKIANCGKDGVNWWI